MAEPARPLGVRSGMRVLTEGGYGARSDVRRVIKGLEGLAHLGRYRTGKRKVFADLGGVRLPP